MTKKRPIAYAVTFTNSFGRRVFHNEKTWKTKAGAEHFIAREKARRAAHGYRFRKPRINRLF